jgi:hypothetical protein
MHSITGREPRASTLDINQPKESQPEPEGPGTGYYLALTFGTLLSSQRADAQKPDPRGPRSLAGCPTLRRFPVFPHPGPGPADLPVRAAQRERYTISEALAQGPSSGLRLAFVAPSAGPARAFSAPRGGLRDFPGAVPAGSHGRRWKVSRLDSVSNRAT